MAETDEGETEHAHCDGCYKIKCQHKSRKSCILMHCPLLCGAAFHACKANEHKELCSEEIVPCVNSFYGCKQVMRRSERGRHLSTCPASVVYCTMEWNRWPVFSRERQERVPFAQKNLHARYGQLDVALAMRDQRILYEAMKAPRRVRRSLRNRLTERFPAVPLTGSHSSYVEGGSMDAAGVTSDEDVGGDAPWDLSRDPPGLQRSICKELFKTDSGSLHLDALDAQGQERNGADINASESVLHGNSNQTTSCTRLDQNDMVSTSKKHFQGCDIVSLPVGEEHMCSGSGAAILAVDINTSNAGEFALVDRPGLTHNLGDEASVDEGTKHACVSHDSHPVSSDVYTAASENLCCDFDKVETIGDILECSISSAGVTSESGFTKRHEIEDSCSKDFSVEGTCQKPNPTLQAPSDKPCTTDQVIVSCSSEEKMFSPEQTIKLPVDVTTSNVDMIISNSSHVPSNFSTTDSNTKAALVAITEKQDMLLDPCLADTPTSQDESSHLSMKNSDEALVNSNRCVDAKSSEVKLSESEGIITEAAESLEFFPDLVFLGIDVAGVSSLHHHNAVVFLPPTGGTIANPGTVVVDLPKEYHRMVEGGSVPPPAIPPPLTLQEILALDLNLESITRYQAKPRSMYTFLCAQNFRRDEYPWHFKNVHSEIHGGLSGWIEARCPLACYGCTYSTRRLNPVSGTVLYNSDVDCFGVRPNSSHCSLSGELSEGARQARARAQKEATPEIYTSKDYDSAVNIKRRSYVKEDDVSEGEPSCQAGFDGGIDVVARNNGNYPGMPNGDEAGFPPSHDVSQFDVESRGTIGERQKSADTHDSLPSCLDSDRDNSSNTKDTSGALLDFDNMTNSQEGAIVKGLDESLFLRALPFEVIQYIARCLDSFSLCNLAMTSRFLRDVCRSIVERRGIVIQEWEKKQFASGSSWQVTYQRWLFSCAFTPCEKWHFEDSPSISEHLKVCPFNVMAEPRTQPFQLCCLSISEDDYRNHDAEKKLQKMYPEFDLTSVQSADSSSRMPGAEVLDHLYVNEIGKSGFSGYKRALKSFAQSCSEQFRDSLDPKLESDTYEEFEDYLDQQLATESSEQLGDSLEPQLDTKTSELFVECLESKTESEILELHDGYMESKRETLNADKSGDSLELKLETKSTEDFGANLEPKQETNTLELSEDSLEPNLGTVSEQVGESMEQTLDKSLENVEDCS